MLGGGGMAGKRGVTVLGAGGEGEGGCKLQLTTTYIYISTGALLLDSCCGVAASSAAGRHWGQLITKPGARLRE